MDIHISIGIHGCPCISMKFMDIQASTFTSGLAMWLGTRSGLAARTHANMNVASGGIVSWGSRAGGQARASQTVVASITHAGTDIEAAWTYFDLMVYGSGNPQRFKANPYPLQLLHHSRFSLASFQAWQCMLTCRKVAL